MAMRNLLIIVSMVGCAMLLSCGGNSRADNEDQAARKAERAATQFVYGTDDGEFKSRSYFEKKLSSGEIKLFNNKVEELVEDIYDDADDFAESIASAEDVARWAIWFMNLPMNSREIGCNAGLWTDSVTTSTNEEVVRCRHTGYTGTSTCSRDRFGWKLKAKTRSPRIKARRRLSSCTMR